MLNTLYEYSYLIKCTNYKDIRLKEHQIVYHQRGEEKQGMHQELCQIDTVSYSLLHSYAHLLLVEAFS